MPPTIDDALLARLEKIEGKLPADVPEEPQYDLSGRLLGYVHQAFPVTVYRPLEKGEPAQIDHPGFASAVANDQGELDQALAAGWTQTYTPPAGPASTKFAPVKGKFAPVAKAKA
jgi:hypothetical protein